MRRCEACLIVPDRPGSAASAAFVGGALLDRWHSPARSLAHGPVPPDPPSAASLLLGWSFDPADRAAPVDRRHRPGSPPSAASTPRIRRTRCRGAGLSRSSPGSRRSRFALQSGIERYDTALFSVHMVQHILLMLVAAPLIALGAPVTLALRVASPHVRQRWLLPILHSRAAAGHCPPRRRLGPLCRCHVGRPLLAAVRSLAREPARSRPRTRPLPSASHCCSGGRPSGSIRDPWRLSHPARLLYVFLQMPQNTFLAVVILNAPAVLYAHYATLDRPWGPSPLFDQQVGGRDHVARRRSHLHCRDVRRSSSAGCARRKRTPRGPSASPMSSGPRSGRGKRGWRNGWPRSGTGS